MSSKEQQLEGEILDEQDANINRYEGYTPNVDNEIHELARHITNQSELSLQKIATSTGGKEGDALSRVSTVAPGVNPFTGDLEERLDPNSPNFESKYWIKNFRAMMDKDPELYKHYSIGITYKDLRSYGNATDADYQTTVLNAPFKYLGQWAKAAISKSTKSEGNVFDILKPMDAVINPGEVVVVLGRPGSGCSTLLKTIASNTHGFHVDPNSQISYEGLTPNEIKKQFRGEVVYNAESDIHFPHLTVWQTLTAAAKFRTPENRMDGVTREQFVSALTQVYMATYGLSHTKNTKVGGDLVRGVSGGERKRVSIAEVTLSGARLQCWDNATRGLDAATALEFIRALRTSADILDTTALIAIYQCSQDAYDLFDKVSLLYEGRQIYFGRADRAKEFFVNMGYFCPARATTADYLTSITSPRERQAAKGMENKVPKTPEEFEAYWKASPEYAELRREIDAKFQANESSDAKLYIKEAKKSKQAKWMRKTSPYTVSFPMQTRYLLKREFQRIRNDMYFHVFTVGANSAMALVLSSIFYNLPKNSDSFFSRGASMFLAVLFNGFSSFLEIMTLFEARPVVEKHKQYALYHPSADALASVLSQVPSKMFVSIAFNLVYYFMVNFRREPGRFFFFYIMNLIATFAMSHLFRLTGSVTNSLAEALVPGHMMLLCLTCFVGFTIPVSGMLGWSRWINYLDPLAYTFEALMANEFHGVQYDCSSYIPVDPSTDSSLPSDSWICNCVAAVAGQTYVDGTEYIATAYDYYNSHKWRNFGITIGFAVFFLACYMFFAEFNEAAKQKGEILLFQRAHLRKMRKQGAINDIEAGNERDITGAEEDDNEVDAIEAGTDIFHWRDVHYTVKIKSEYREILSGVDGWVKPGTLTALMGASGAGKTTLLDVLANRVTMGVVTGNMFVNGHLRDSSFQRSTGYVQQQDLHLSTATVREALRFSAYLRQPHSVTRAEKNAYVEEVIKILDMQKYSDAVVGVAGEGLNVEQRKRLTIGVELAAKPKLLLFLDEPTSGLDSQTAWSICQLMRKLANHGQAILCTIHQPSAILMQEFDRLLFLARGGKTVYFGDLGEGCQTLIDYFESHGAPKCPPEANPAEWMLHVIGAAPGSHANQDYHQVWLDSAERKAVKDELASMERELVKIPIDQNVDKKEFAAPLWDQYLVVTERVFQQFWRTPTYIWAKLFLSIASSLFVGFIFFKSKNSEQGLQNQMFAIFMYATVYNPTLQQVLPTFVSQRDLYETRERPSKTFSWKAFFLAQVTAEIPWNAFIGTIGFLCLYYPAGFYSNAQANGAHEYHARGAYGWFLSVLYYVFIGSMAHLCIAGVQLADMAGNIGYLCFTLCLTFCGVLVGPSALPGFWIFLYRVSPLTYFVNGYFSNAVAHVDVKCASNELRVMNPANGSTCGEYLASYIEAAGTGYVNNPDATSDCEFCSLSTTDDFLASVSLSYDRKWRDLGIFCAYIVFNICAAIFIYWLARVPKRSSRVKDEKPEAKPTESPSADETSLNEKNSSTSA